ncbi:unnamed protein product [Paramecium sonneborni]|uniref:Uncharacterized protein n=1 Tax=Paramecium sonneborni TaxID=65129 RepID=A0A8S1LC37_9CILI|nr:unnamed protein product [Paramecium sonneborni]
MGNLIQKNQIQEEQERLKVYLELNSTKILLNQNISGKVHFKVPQFMLGNFDLNLKIYGIENAYYHFKERDNSVYKYNIKDHQFFHKTINLFKNAIINELDEYWFVEFDWNPEVQIPSLDYQNGSDFKCSREYILEAELLCKNSKRKTILEQCRQRVLFYIDTDELKEEGKKNKLKNFQGQVDEDKNQKIEAITTYKWLRQKKGLVFASFEADKCIYFNNDNLFVKADVDNTFGHLQIKSAKILFYLEFIIKEKILQGMPKILLCEENLQKIDQFVYQGQMNFTITKQLNLPYQSVSERIGCRYIIVLQLIFEQQCLGSGVDNVEFILPYMNYFRDNSDNIEPELESKTEIKNIERKNKLMNVKQELVSEKRTNLIKDQEFLNNKETRVAQLTQVLHIK